MPKLLAQKRKKVNFMVNEDVMGRLEQLIPAGQRSDFVNEAMNDALIGYGRKKAFEFFAEFRKEQKPLPAGSIVKFLRNERAKRQKKLGY